MPLDWDWGAMAAVWAADEDTAAAFEQGLVGSGLLEWDEYSRRYSLHATIHAFLERRAELAVYERHAAHYAALMLQHGHETLRRLKGDFDTALTTLDREIGQMERAQRRAVGSEPTSFWDARLLDYAFACDTYFRLRGRYPEHIIWSEAGRQAALRQGWERDAATLLRNIANVYRTMGRYDKAIAAHQAAITVYQALNLESDLAMALGNLGNVYADQRRYEEAIAQYQQSLEIKRRIGDTPGTAKALGNLGSVYADQGRYEEALAHHQQSLEISRRIGNIPDTAMTLGNLGIVYENQGRYDEAITHYQ
jgi:tetratricopeptide (TPR) repeat protein